MMSVDTIVVGLGSIGARHVRVLSALGRKVMTVSRRSGSDFSDIDGAIKATLSNYIVVANETSAHDMTVRKIVELGFEGDVLVEKPLFAERATLPAHKFRGLYVGYNLRFHPVLTYLRSELGTERILSASIIVGQHLSQWRPERDLRSTASASAAFGGGVIRDLSHEFDYIFWLFGPWIRVCGLLNNSGSLGIETEDVCAALIECPACPIVSVHLDYHHRPGTRLVTITTAKHTYVADLMNNVIDIDGARKPFSCERDDTYRDMHLGVFTDDSRICEAADGLLVVDFIDALEQSARSGNWVVR